MLGGKIQISSQRGAGMCIMLTLPTHAPHELAPGDAGEASAKGSAHDATASPVPAFPAPSRLM